MISTALIMTSQSLSVSIHSLKRFGEKFEKAFREFFKMPPKEVIILRNLERQPIE